MPLTAAQLAKQIDASLQGDPELTLNACASLDDASANDLSFLANRKYIPNLKSSHAGAVVISPDDAPLAGDRTQLIADDPYFAFRQAMVALVGFRPHPGEFISDHAIVAGSARVGQGCHIAPFAVISPNATLGNNCVIHPHAHIGPNVRLGDDCTLFPNTVIYEDCVLGNRVTLHAGCSIGQDGFGYATHHGQHHKLPQSGNVIIEDDVEMGALCSVDRATLGSTIIGQGTKFSNSVTIGHGCHVGKHNLFVAQVGLAGSVHTGDYVVMGGQVGIAGHLKIADRVQIAAKSGVMHDLEADGKYGGLPAQPFTETKRQLLATTRLPALITQVRNLEKRLDQLTNRLDPSS